MPKWMRWAILAIAVIALFRNPSGTAQFVHQAITSLFTFIGKV